MKTPQQQKGTLGENLAVRFLRQKGYEILFRNYKYGRKEIDIIAKDSEQTLVFVEVKLRSSDAYGTPEETVSTKQQNRIMAAAEHYIEHTNWEHDIRFDIIAIQLRQGLPPMINHFEDAFY